MLFQFLEALRAHHKPGKGRGGKGAAPVAGHGGRGGRGGGRGRGGSQARAAPLMKMDVSTDEEDEDEDGNTGEDASDSALEVKIEHQVNELLSEYGGRCLRHYACTTIGRKHIDFSHQQIRAWGTALVCRYLAACPI